ncbi:MAG: hypothetical protein SFU25_04590, partial [Candidatus Caenarcaniphilales bacterium]|nr:hypothetical protein [Candidatus Caenarcaniphilales bacterium]
IIDDIYPVHSAVISGEDAQEIGLKINLLNQNDELWKKIWLLFCMYDYDSKLEGISKFFEGSRVSHAIVIKENN